MTKEEIEEGRRLQSRQDQFAFEAWLIRHAEELLALAESERSEYARGLRRGLELAKEHSELCCDGEGPGGECSPNACIDFSRADEAVDTECR